MTKSPRCKKTSQVQRAIVAHLRISSPELFASISEEQIIQQMFLGRGLRLTRYGLEIMQRFFQSCRIDIAAEELRQATHQIFLEHIARMPYYCGDDHVVLFDQLLGYKLRLTGGRLSVLAQITS